MTRFKFAPIFLILLLALVPFAAHAQDFDGTLVFGTPSVANIINGEPVTFEYTLTEPRTVQFQAVGVSTTNTIIVLLDGEVVAEQPAEQGSPINNIEVTLDAGTYAVQVSPQPGENGQVVLIVANEFPVVIETLIPNVPISASVSTENSTARYAFGAQAEPAALVIESSSEGDGISVRVEESLSGAAIATFRLPVREARFLFPNIDQSYTVEVRLEDDGETGEQSYSICLEVDFFGACDAQDAQPIPTVAATNVVLPSATPAATIVNNAACTVTPNAPSINVRQSASLNAPIVGAMTTGTSANVIGISPDGGWYNIQFNSLNGWVSISVVTASGNCVNVPVVQPPAIPPTLIPPTPTLAPTIPAPPTQPPPPPTQSGPCLITMTGEALIYQQPNAIPDYIQDQVQSGYQLIPVGRLADNSWWKTNYANAWIQTSLFGSVAQVTGDCSGLPVISS